jgi:hypothetical protein
MPILRYIVWVATSLLALLFVANWCLPEPPREAREGIDKPIIRIASVQQPPDSVFIDTNQPTIIPPPSPVENAIPAPPPSLSLLQSYASVEPPALSVSVDQKKRKSPKGQKAAKIVTYQSPPIITHMGVTGGPTITAPPTQLSLLDIVSGMGKRLFNLR